VLLLLAGGVAADYWVTLPETTVAHYVGRQACIDCHREQADAFAGSHHDLAMDLATEQTVLGDFNDVSFEHHGIVSRLFRDGERFMIHTEGPDGEPADFEVKYVFGVEPLQQYMVEFDRDAETPEDAIARLQVLRISWDTVRGEWFYLEPPDVTDKLSPDDDLHWTGITQRWNTMCAECHSTDVRKNYDPQTGRYATMFSEIDVSCEACHGPGSTHVQLATSRSLFWDRKLGYGLARLKGDETENDLQIEACAPCHSRRGMIAAGFEAGHDLCDFFDPAPLREMLYHADGQIKDEVYVYGSFVQSKMYHKGIRCTDCHDPHSLQLKAPGNQVCTSCHQHPAGKYDTPSHHKHVPGKPGSMCVDCHMPERTYMAVDPRRDHSLRIPRPDLSVALGTPNACTGCHLEPQRVAEAKRSALREYADWQRMAAEDEEIASEIERVDRWCDEACDRWYGEDRQQPEHYATALAAHRRGAPDAAARLTALAKRVDQVPAIARATAVEELGTVIGTADGATAWRTAADLLEDASPLVRAAAVRTLAQAPADGRGPQRLASLLTPRLRDSARLVRSAAVRALAVSRAHTALTPAAEQLFEQRVEEVREGLAVNADRAGAHLEWALICESLGRVDQAIEAYRLAMKVEPGTVGPRSNLAQLLDDLARVQSQRGQIDAGQLAEMRRTVQKLRAQELKLLERDAALLPDSGPLQYRLGMAYYLNDRLEDAERALRRAVELDPNEDFELALRLLRERMAELSEESTGTTLKPSRDDP
jgi:tetratricopeptide (TPR) repeat protein